MGQRLKVEGLEDRIRGLAAPVAEGFGLELVDVAFTSEFGRKILFHEVRPTWTEVEERVKQQK